MPNRCPTSASAAPASARAAQQKPTFVGTGLDGSLGHRVFDIATVLNFIHPMADPAPLQQAMLQSYPATRFVTLTDLPVFQALRALKDVV